jgi:Cd2+/Zn2+-exporting ATPase
MEKIKINVDLVLPDVPNERDECVQRIISATESKKGIEKVHIVPGTETSKAKLCFHYDPNEISIEQVQKIAADAGAEITERFGHLLLEVKGIRHVRHARVIEVSLKRLKGVISVSASASGWISIEFDHHEINPAKIYKQVNKIGLQIISPDLKSIIIHKHDDHKHEASDHDHSHDNVFGEKTELIFAIICGALLGIGFGLSFVKNIPTFIPIACYIGAYFFGGFYTTKEAYAGISKGKFEIDFLMLVAAIGAAILGQWAEGSLLLFLFSLGHSLEHYAMEKAKKSIAALTDLAPKTALLKRAGS